MQEKMNELLKDTININSIEKLDKAKDEFLSYEKEFEKIQDEFKQQDKNDLIDYLIKDISNNEFIANNLQLLFDSEHEIEKSFDSIYDLQEKKIDLIAQFDRDYPIENEIRKKLDHEVIEKKDFKLSQNKFEQGVIAKLDLNQMEENLLTVNKLVYSTEFDCMVDYISFYKAIAAQKI